MDEKQTKIIIIAGKARAGKDTSANFLKEIYENQGKKVLNIQYSSYIKEYAKKISDWDGSEETKPRALLQQLGTDIIRNRIDELFFTKKIIDDLKVYSFFFDVITISDARFKIEIDEPRKIFDNIVALHIVRPNFDNGLTEEQKHHPSEIDLDDYQGFNHEIINDGTLEDLKVKLEKLTEVI